MTRSGISLRKDKSDLDAVRKLLVSMIRDGDSDRAIDMILELLADMRDQNDALEVRLQNALRRLYGRRSEKLSKEQLELFAQLLGNEAPAPEAPAASAPADAASTTADADAPETKKAPPASAKRGHGRSEMPEGLPRKVTRVPVPEAERVCTCGRERALIGVETSWHIEYTPGSFHVAVTECEKCACPHCRDAVVTAPAPGKVIPGGAAGPGLLARIVVDKAEDNLPLVRQVRRLSREGLHVPTTTLEGWWSQSVDLLAGLHAALVDEALGAWLPAIDATGLDVLDRGHPKGLRPGHLWGVEGARAVAFVYAPVKSDGLEELLRRCARADGIVARPVACDGEALFPSVRTRAELDLVFVHCTMHSRRYFERALKDGDLRAVLPMRIYKDLYAIERRANEERVSIEERTRRRQSESWPLLEELRAWVTEIRPKVPPSTPLGKAIGYIERRWLSLTVFVLDGRIPLDTGEIERQIRRIAVGRNAWNLTGSDDGARRVAIASSLTATCRRLGVDPFAYLRDVFRAIADGTSAAQLVAGFTPWAWAERNEPRSEPAAAVDAA